MFFFFFSPPLFLEISSVHLLKAVREIVGCIVMLGNKRYLNLEKEVIDLRLPMSGEGTDCNS